MDTISDVPNAGTNGVTAPGEIPSPVKRSGAPSAFAGFVNPFAGFVPGTYEITEDAKSLARA
jgi:hypothetical protein